MSERDGYQPGVPCRVASVHPDPEKAVNFYTELFGWEAEKTMSSDPPDKYFMCTLRGRAVAAVGSQRGGGVPSVPAWDTHVWVESSNEVATRVVEEGGSVVVEAFDLRDAGRMAVVAEPGGAVFGLWEPGEHRGAGVINEPGAWAMSILNTGDPEGAKAFYGEVFGWETDMFGEIALWRLPGYVGGEPEQPVPRDVIGVMASRVPSLSSDARKTSSGRFALWKYDVRSPQRGGSGESSYSCKKEIDSTIPEDPQHASEGEGDLLPMRRLARSTVGSETTRLEVLKLSLI